MTTFRVWPGGAPGSEARTQVEETFDWLGELRVRNVADPTLTVVRPDPASATGAAAVIAPGGGFQMLSWESEGTELAAWLAERGVTSFILKYRLADTGPTRDDFEHASFALFEHLAAIDADPTRDTDSLLDMLDREPIALAAKDGRRAVRVVRERATEFAIDPDRVAMIGFSAGAIVTTLTAASPDPDDRPDLVVAVYGGALDGPVPANAPPAIFLMAADDPLTRRVLPVHDAWRGALRPTELHVWEQGGHGFGMRLRGLPVDSWPDRMWEWLGSHGFH